ncbi:hypothetical protein MCOR25_006943 [Pyricularia grisea]|nr:hypothetical protein MCOR25_006943 [Pyricularia grisea]
MTRVHVIPLQRAPPSSPKIIEWRFDPSLESEITTLAAWCQINQPQREPLQDTTDSELLGDEFDEHDDGDADGTNCLAQLSLDEDDGRTRDFLDRLAELLCCKKDPKLITSTGMVYDDEHVIIVASRNWSPKKTWSKSDIDMLESLAHLLERVSSDDVFKTHPIPELQKALVDYYKARICHHARELVRIEAGKTGMNFFTQNCVDVVSGRLPVWDFVSMVHDDISHSTDFYSRLKACLTERKLRMIVQELGFIRRPMQGAGAFLSLAQLQTGFRSVKIVLLESAAPRHVEIRQWPGGELRLKQTQRQRLHAQAQMPKYVHAEMTLMTYLLGPTDGLGRDLQVFPYLGVSKKTCLLCGHMIKEVGRFTARGNHGKIYSQWTLPSPMWIESRAEQSLDEAVRQLRRVVVGEAAKEDLPARDMEKESVMAAPAKPRPGPYRTLFNSYVSDPRSLSREADWWSRIHHQRGDESSADDDEPRGHPSGTADEDKLERLGSNEPEAPPAPLCTLCKEACKPGNACTKCGNALYCSVDCRNSDWIRHKYACSLGRPLDATDDLMRCCHADDYLELDQDASKEFGFMCLGRAPDRLFLFEIYRTLIVDLGVEEEELREAVRLDKLKEMLIRRCRQTNDAKMINFAKWLESKEGFRANGDGPGIQSMLDAAQEKLLGPEDRKVPLIDLEPAEKRNAVVFYTQILNGFQPAADEDNWIDLGFCAATDSSAELRLYQAYAALVEACTFDEFWRAVADCSMVALFQKHGLHERISGMRAFEVLMATPYTHSVWHLKRFTRVNDPQPHRAVTVDYGFYKCESVHERMRLKDTYRTLFERGVDGLELHEACISGNLAGFVESALGDMPIPRRLVQNPYPLEDCPHAGMTAGAVVSVPASQMGAYLNRSERPKNAMLCPIPDDCDDELRKTLHDNAVFRGAQLRKRYTIVDGQLFQELSLMEG